MIGTKVLQRSGPTKTLFETRETMRLIAGGNLTSFHSGTISVSAVERTKKRTVPLKSQLIFEGKLNLLLYVAQDVWQIADKLGMGEGARFDLKVNQPTDSRTVSWCHGSLAIGSPRV